MEQEQISSSQIRKRAENLHVLYEGDLREMFLFMFLQKQKVLHVFITQLLLFTSELNNQANKQHTLL